ncbi:MAG: 3-phosphoshikimate 1-carboxyvinyltransferase [Nitrospiraceae bacterium]|nr:MAG: 3-phosphoshikimate 1-carboxyvinyltransferase [Nitrospiraceae bacterium]
MDRIEISKANVLKGSVSIPPDKSISHRAILFSSIAKGKSFVKNILRAGDIDATLEACRSLGVSIEDHGDHVIIHGKGLHGLSEPANIIDCGNSGTTLRLISGILAAHPFFSVLTGDESLRKRPMARIIEPLSLMGADIKARGGNQFPPLGIRGNQLKPITYTMPIASAQVKSSLLLAGLFTDGITEITEPVQSRDHSEKMLSFLGADITVKDMQITVRGGKDLRASEISVPGDFSSAAFFIIAALMIPSSEITLKKVGINPTRTGLLTILQQMGARIEVTNIHDVSGESVANISCTGMDRLQAVHIKKEMIPSLIDEVPILCVISALADGTTTIRGAEELRVKESDRIASMASELRKMGVTIEEYPDGISIQGPADLRGATVDSYGDHRIAMALAIAALAAEGTTTIRGCSAVNISFPGFFDAIRSIVR